MTHPHTHLALFVDVFLEVVLLAHDGLGDEVLVVDTDCGQQGGVGGLGQPRDLGGLLEVLVFQVQLALQGGDLTSGISGSHSDRDEGIIVKELRYLFSSFYIW